MRIAVAGGTGTVGQYVVEAARAAGHEAVVLSRTTGVDVRDGTGLPAALAGVDVVVDTLGPPSSRRAAAEAFFTATARQLQQAGTRAGVGHIVSLSILELEAVPGFGYFRAKLAHERAVTAGPVPATILRAAQFHEFAGQMVRRTRLGRLALVPRMESQPVAARTVAEHLLSLAQTQPGGCRDLAGPEVHELPELARRLVAARGERVHVLGVPLPGQAGRALRDGAAVPPLGTVTDGPPFATWLTGPDALRVPLA